MEARPGCSYCGCRPQSTILTVEGALLTGGSEGRTPVIIYYEARWTRNRRRILQGVTLLLLFILASLAINSQSHTGSNGVPYQGLTLTVDAKHAGRAIPSTLFGVFFEEINHAGAGGIWAELVSNRGFEAGGPSTPSNIAPWYPVGDGTQVALATERSSCFERNPVALRIDILCSRVGSNICPEGGAGVANPGFWGMDISAGNRYRVVLWLLSKAAVSLSIAFTSSNGQTLAQEDLAVGSSTSSKWNRHELTLTASATDHEARLVVLSSDKGTFWLDQVSAMPVNTYKGHGFRKELAGMLEDLNPGFFRFPGGCYVEGGRLINAWRWRETVGPWQERPGHFGDVWNYWSDDGLGYFEYLQLAEDLGAPPVWVFNNGISHGDEVPTSLIAPFIEDTLDGIEFARGPVTSQWGSLRASMGHPDPFPLHHIAIGNEDCGRLNYRGNYLEFYGAIKAKYPDISLISNCDATSKPLDHPADLYDFHVYTSASNLFAMSHQFDHTSRVGPKVFVSEYAVVGGDSGTGTLLAALGEAAFMIGLELNSDVVEMASYAPLFVNDHDRRWNPDAIVFNSWQQYGTPSYWVQQLFRHSNGAQLLPFSLEAGSTRSGASAIVASVVRRHSVRDLTDFLVIKIVNFGKDVLPIRIEVEDMQTHGLLSAASTVTILSSGDVMDENSFREPDKVAPQQSKLANLSAETEWLLPAHSFFTLDLQVSNLLCVNSTKEVST